MQTSMKVSFGVAALMATGLVMFGPAMAGKHVPSPSVEVRMTAVVASADGLIPRN
jgi:hypothetical protein